MSSAIRTGSWSGTSNAEMITRTVLVRPKIAPAVISGEGLHPSSAPWCSSSETLENPWRSPYSTRSSVAW